MGHLQKLMHGIPGVICDLVGGWSVLQLMWLRID